MGRRVKVDGASAEVDMTPIIDIVFNLIIFFMIASELNNRSVEQINVPYASEAQKMQKLAAGGDVAKVLQINVLKDGAVKVRGLTYSVDPTVKGNPPLSEFIEIEAAAYEREAPEAGQTGTPPSALRVNIRADRESRFRFVQGVFDACVKNGVYKTSIAADPDTPKVH